MPKKGKGRSGMSAKRGGAAADHAGSDDETFADNASVISNASEQSFAREEGGAGGFGAIPENDDGGEGGGDETADDVFEDKLRDAIEMATQKSAAGRVGALNAIGVAFGKKFLPDFVEGRRMTIADVVEKSLKRGKGAEQVAAANLAVSLIIQLRGDADDIYREIKPILAVIINDNSAPPSARVACAHALGNLCFLAAQAIAEVQSVMEMLEALFAGGLTLSDLATAALSSWTLLATVMPYSVVQDSLVRLAPPFAILLESPDVDLRIAVGEAIAVLYEFVGGEGDGDDSDGENYASNSANNAVEEAMEDLVPKIQSLSTDCHKYRSKKDRKEQKSSFRDILHTIEEGEEFYEKVKINSVEKLEIDSWAQKKQYQAISRALASGTNMHLTENDLIRGVFNLGNPLPSLSMLNANRPSKSQRQLANQQAFKVRSQARNKHRDKRSAVI